MGTSSTYQYLQPVDTMGAADKEPPRAIDYTRQGIITKLFSVNAT
jgi:hypothetical protein